MSDGGSIDDFLSSEIDENAVNALVGSLETHFATTNSIQLSKNVLVSPNSNHACSAIIRPYTFLRPNQNAIPQQNGPVSISMQNIQTFVNTKSCNAEILGISSILNSSNKPILVSSDRNLSDVNNSLSIASKLCHNGQNVSVCHAAPRMQVSNAALQSSACTLQLSNVGNVLRSSNPVTLVNNVGLLVTGTGSARTHVDIPACTAVYNVSEGISSDGKSSTVVHNGTAHTSQLGKDGFVRPLIKQNIAKHESHSAPVLKQHPFTQQYALTQNAIKQESIIPVLSQVSCFPCTGSVTQCLPGIIMRNHPVQSVVVAPRQASVTTQANMSQPVEVINVSGRQAAAKFASIGPITMVKGGMRIATPVRLSQPHSIAPRQTMPLGSTTARLAAPPGMLLMRSEQHGLVLVQTNQAPGSAGLRGTANINQSTAIKVQQPLTSGPVVQAHTSTIVIQPQVVQSVGLPSTRPIATQPDRLPLQSTVQPVELGRTMPTDTAPSNTACSDNNNRAIGENVKKCKNFLSTLLKLATNQPTSTVMNVRDLIQGLIDGKVEPEVFTQRLQLELKSSPQPYLVPFLKRSLPMLRHAMLVNKLEIENITPPPIGFLHFPMSASSLSRPPPMSTVSSQQHPPALRHQTHHQIGPKPLKSFQSTVHQAISQRHAKPVISSSFGQSGSVHQLTAAFAPGQRRQTLTIGVNQMLPANVSQLGPASSKVLGQMCKLQSVQRPAVSSALLQTAGEQRSLGQTCVPRAVASTAGVVAVKEAKKFDSLKEDNDDINDVATMGGVNLSEETKNILATNSELVGSQIRSCQERLFLSQDNLMSRITASARKHGLDTVSPEVGRLLSHAIHLRLCELAGRLAAVTEHRVQLYKMDQRYEQTSAIRGQLVFLDELHRAEKRRHDEEEREMLLRAMKSRSKSEDPEQLRLRQKARDLQQAEAEIIRQREANVTALAAIGPRKKRKLNSDDANADDAAVGCSFSTSTSTPNSLQSSSGLPAVFGRPRMKRAILKDIQFLMEQDPHLCRSHLLYRTYLK